jgi:hypothetical protein
VIPHGSRPGPPSRKAVSRRPQSSAEEVRAARDQDDAGEVDTGWIELFDQPSADLAGERGANPD